MVEDQIAIEDVKRLRLDRGDTLVLYVAEDVSPEEIDRLARHLRSEFNDAGVGVMVVPKPMELAVLSEREAAALRVDRQAPHTG